MTKTFDPQNILSFYREAEKLKAVLRHSFLSSGRQESVAEHTWMMALLAMVLIPQIDQPLDQAKVLRMIIVHDLAEAVTQDMPAWEGMKAKSEKLKAEREAITKILKPLNTAMQQELLALWEEYEARETPEARFVKALDTLDVIAQHNVADIATWDDNDYLWQLSLLQDSFFDFSAVLRQLKDELDTWTIDKVKKEGELRKLDQKELAKRMEKEGIDSHLKRK